jgi:DNA polymerase-3 subunit delta'
MAQGKAAYEGVAGNHTLLAGLLRDVRDNRLNHAYILDGPQGSGKHTVARWLSAAIACDNRPGRELAQTDSQSEQMSLFEEFPAPPRVIPPDAPLPCGVCPACRKVLEGNSPDIRLVGREGKASLGVEAVRFLRQDVLIPPGELDRKIYILEDAETMTVQAQNALLLTLEEPPPYVLFLLLCNGVNALLETVRSRAPVLRTQLLPDAVVRDYLQSRRHLPEDQMETVLLLAGGCIGQAMDLSDARTLGAVMRSRTLCTDFLEGCALHQADRVLSCLNQWGTQREAVCDLLATLTQALRDLILLRAGESVRLTFYTNREKALDMTARFTKRELLALYHAVGRARDVLEANGNVRLTLTQMSVEAGVL